MTWATPTFSIGGITVDVPQALELTQSLEDQGGVAKLRMGSGRLLPQKYWTRAKATLSGSGQVPQGLSALDWTAPQAVSLPYPLAITSATAAAAIPAARRSDVPVTAFAWVNGMPVPTPVTMTVNAAAATAVAGATGYTFLWTPAFTAMVTKTESVDRANRSQGFTLTLEEV